MAKKVFIKGSKEPKIKKKEVVETADVEEVEGLDDDIIETADSKEEKVSIFEELQKHSIEEEKIEEILERIAKLEHEIETLTLELRKYNEKTLVKILESKDAYSKFYRYSEKAYPVDHKTNKTKLEYETDLWSKLKWFIPIGLVIMFVTVVSLLVLMFK